MARLISRSDLARLAGVSPAAITKACKGQLAPACDGRRIDLDHTAAQAYLACGRAGAQRRQADRPQTEDADPVAVGDQGTTGRRRESPQRGGTARRPAPSKALQASPDAEHSDEDDPIEGLAELTLNELIKRYGTVTRFRDWLVARKTLEDIREKKLKNLETEGKLISREPVKVHVFGAIDSAFRRLLQDAPKTIARRAYAAAKSDVSIEDTEATVREILSSILNPVKATAVRVLRDGEPP